MRRIAIRTPGGSLGFANPKLLLALALVIALAVFLKVSNPHKEFSTSDYWASAALADVAAVPEEALLPGNRNGPVLMWAAMQVDDPEIIRALIERGADPDESDPFFKGTPLTAAATYGRHPEILAELVKHGADVNKRVHAGETALLLAARYNTNPGIVAELIRLGADRSAENALGQDALDLASKEGNRNAMAELSR